MFKMTARSMCGKRKGGRCGNAKPYGSKYLLRKCLVLVSRVQIPPRGILGALGKGFLQQLWNKHPLHPLVCLPCWREECVSRFPCGDISQNIQTHVKQLFKGCRDSRKTSNPPSNTSATTLVLVPITKRPKMLCWEPSRTSVSSARPCWVWFHRAVNWRPAEKAETVIKHCQNSLIKHDKTPSTCCHMSKRPSTSSIGSTSVPPLPGPSQAMAYPSPPSYPKLSSVSSM